MSRDAHVVQVSRNALVTLIESVRVRCILLWHAERWSPEKAAKHSGYFARIIQAEAAAAKHREEDDADEEGREAPGTNENAGAFPNKPAAVSEKVKLLRSRRLSRSTTSSSSVASSILAK